MFKKLFVLTVICLSVGFFGFAGELKEFPDYLKWRSIEGYNGQHSYCTRVQKYHYVYLDASGEEQTAMNYFFVNDSNGDKVRFLVDKYGQEVLATYFYSDENTYCPRCVKCIKPVYQRHDFYIRSHPNEPWQYVSWREAQKFLRSRGIFVRDISK